VAGVVHDELLARDGGSGGVQQPGRLGQLLLGRGDQPWQDRG
jgi:hypothetical protein